MALGGLFLEHPQERAQWSEAAWHAVVLEKYGEVPWITLDEELR